jgi:hypothetical protein
VLGDDFLKSRRRKACLAGESVDSSTSVVIRATELSTGDGPCPSSFMKLIISFLVICPFVLE